MEDFNETKERLIHEIQEPTLRDSSLDDEKAHHEIRPLLKSIPHASSVGMVSTQNGGILRGSRTREETFAFEDEQEYYHQPTSIMHPSEDQYEQARTLLYDNVKKGSPSKTDAKLRKKGSLIDSHITIGFFHPEDRFRGQLLVREAYQMEIFKCQT